MLTKMFHTAMLVAMVMFCVVPLFSGGNAEGPMLASIVSASTLIGLQKTFKALFRESFDAVEPMWQKVAMEVPSENAEEAYQWLGAVPSMKEWLDEKAFEELRGFDFTIKNKDWESTIAVDRNHIEDDQLGLYRPRIMALGEEAKRHPDELVSLARSTGGATLCYDGQFFYDTDHAAGKSGTLSNLLTGTGVTTAQWTADFRAARAAFRKFKDDQGKPFIRRMGKLSLLVTIPPDLEGVVEEVANATTINNTDNVLKGAFEYIVDQYIGDTNDWYLDYAGAPVKPFVVQIRKRPVFVAMDNQEASDSTFLRKRYLYGVEARYNAGLGLWQLSIKTTNT